MIVLEKNIPMETFREEEDGIIFQNWRELENNKPKVCLSPDWDKLILMQKIGMLSNVIVRDDGRIVGYSIILHSPHLHYKEDVFSVVSSMYLKPEYRLSTSGLKMMKAIEEEARTHLASVLMYHAKPYTTLERILFKKGFRMEETSYIKILKE